MGDAQDYRGGEFPKRSAPSFLRLRYPGAPFKNQVFDGVLANHVLYHLNDISRGVREIARVLSPTGWLLATTNSEKIHPTIIKFHYRALDELKIPYTPELPSPFSMENGVEYLRGTFHEVERHYFEDEAEYKSADDFVATYLTIGRYRNLLLRDDVDTETKLRVPSTVRRLAKELISNQGLRTPILMGALSVECRWLGAAAAARPLGLLGAQNCCECGLNREGAVVQLADFQERIEAIYGARDRRRGPDGTYRRLVEEIGEVARALRFEDPQALADEVSDVLAWTVSLASICGVDVAMAASRYANGCPRCRATPCACPPDSR